MWPGSSIIARVLSSIAPATRSARERITARDRDSNFFILRSPPGAGRASARYVEAAVVIAIENGGKSGTKRR